MTSQLDFEDSRKKECEDSGVVGEWLVGEFSGGTNSHRLVAGRVTFPGADDFYVETTEIVQLLDSGIHRETYGYYLVCSDESLIGHCEIGGFERSDEHGEHIHCGIHIPGGDPFGPISFKDAMLYAWKVIGRALDGEEDHCPPGVRDGSA